MSGQAQAWLVLFVVKALAVWFVGIGIKVALYNPIAEADAFFSHDQRFQVGVSCAICYGINGLMAPLHSPTFRDYYAELLGYAVGAISFVLWIANVVCMVCATWLVVPPYEYLAIQAGLGVLHMVVSHIELVWFPAHVKRKNRASPLH